MISVLVLAFLLSIEMLLGLVTRAHGLRVHAHRDLPPAIIITIHV